MGGFVVDAHVHAWEMPSDRYPWSPLRNMRPQEPATVELLLDTIQKHGVSKAIIVQPSNYGYDHSYVVDCLARYPGRFGAVALLDFRADDAPQRLATLVGRGIRGVRLYLYGESDLSWLGDRATHRVLEKTAELNVVVCVFGRWDMMQRVDLLVHQHKMVNFVIDHLGHPDVQRQETWRPILHLADMPNVAIKVSDFPTLSRQPYPFTDVYPFVRRVYEVFTPSRMMWASNFPHILHQAGYEAALKLIDIALPNLAAIERRQIMGETAAKLWG